ncbi:MAG TPA: hypothetical protein VN903_30940 [Polyangia bacterium]|jgi:hypothetical protein|nr:hypothetical protein [Polyangia bacterium]
MNLGRWWCSRFHWYRRVTSGGKLSALVCDECNRRVPVNLSDPVKRKRLVAQRSIGKRVVQMPKKARG